jgi:glutamate/tyrosine decarboxylase-like PLP-dependent enzyme
VTGLMPEPTEQLRQELAEPLPHPAPEALRQQAIQALDWLLEHWKSLPGEPVGRRATGAAMKALLDEAPPENGLGFEQAFSDFRQHVATHAMRLNHPRFLAFIPSAPTLYSAIADFLVSGTNYFCGVWIEAAGAAQVERTVLGWFRRLLGMPAETRGIITSGGSEANLTALVAAREVLDPTERDRAVLYLSDQRHGSMDRAARIMGLSQDRIRLIRSTGVFRMDTAALLQEIHRDRARGLVPWVVSANAGATNTGATDPLEDIAGICRSQSIWFHVDAAYGWPAVLLPQGKELLTGIDQADSTTLDPHKWFAQPFECGCVLVRNGRKLEQAFHIRPDYMQDVTGEPDEINFADHGLSLTRRFRALKIWLSVRTLGLGWFRSLVERSCRLADLAQHLLESAGCFEIMCPRQLSIVCFRYRPAKGVSDARELDTLNLALVEDLRLSGRGFISSTKLNGSVALRFCFVNWRTTAADVEEIVNLLASLGEQRLRK